MTGDLEPPAGWLTRFRLGVVSGAALLLLWVALCTIPAFLAWLLPGGDTSPASAAVKAGTLLALDAAHGGVRLDGTFTTLTPLLLTLLLGLLVATQARRSETWSGVIGLAVGYGAASGLLAEWATLGATRAPAGRSLGAGLLFVAVVAGAARGLEAGWPRVGVRWQRVIRAGGVAAAGYLLAGSLLAAAMLGIHFHDAASLQHQLAPNAAGLPVALLGVAATPNAALAAVGYLTGPGFQVGAHTSVSVAAASHGPLPAFPLLAALPHGSPTSWLGALLIVLAAVAAGACSVRVLARSGSWQGVLTDAMAAAAVCGVILAALTALAAGGVGAEALRHVGAAWWQVGSAGALAVALGAACCLGVRRLSASRASVPLARAFQLRAVPGDKKPSRADDAAESGSGAQAPASRSRQVS